MATHHKGPPAEVRALDAYIKLNRALDRMQNELMRKMTEHGLTMPQFGVLEALYHLGPSSQGDLGRKLLRSGANVTTVVDNLEKAALVTRTRSPADRRVVTVALTPAGRKLIAAVFPEHAAQIADLMKGLSPVEQEALGALCKKLGTSITPAVE